MKTINPKFNSKTYGCTSVILPKESAEELIKNAEMDLINIEIVNEDDTRVVEKDMDKGDILALDTGRVLVGEDGTERYVSDLIWNIGNYKTTSEQIRCGIIHFVNELRQSKADPAIIHIYSDIERCSMMIPYNTICLMVENEINLFIKNSPLWAVVIEKNSLSDKYFLQFDPDELGKTKKKKKKKKKKERKK